MDATDRAEILALEDYARALLACRCRDADGPADQEEAKHLDDLRRLAMLLGTPRSPALPLEAPPGLPARPSSGLPLDGTADGTGVES